MFSTLEMMINFWHRAVPRPNIGAQLFWLMQDWLASAGVSRRKRYGRRALQHCLRVDC